MRARFSRKSVHEYNGWLMGTLNPKKPLNAAVANQLCMVLENVILSLF
jgi:hypothetical protein